ncbi:MAG TPA: trehalose-phosphatase [Gammaproteobacteria bacterium]|jgi:trehalose 6-phosphate phosphatase
MRAPLWPKNPALFLDLDGTLLEFADDPASVEVGRSLRSLLDRLQRVTHGALAFVSGRSLADLDRLLGPGQFPLGAVHGLERRDAGGRRSTAEFDEREVARIREALQEIVERHPGTMLEDKGLTLALHYRRCPELEESLVEQVEARLSDIASRLKLMRGNMVLEVKPGDGNKGTAIAAFMEEEPFSGRTPVFIGDDVTDEDGFRVVNELGGVSVKVHSGQTCARHRLPDTQAVLSWLGELASGESQ